MTRERLLADLFARTVAGLVVFVGIVAWSYLVTGGWPPGWLLLGSSIGGLVSPMAWKAIRRSRGDFPSNQPIDDGTRSEG